MNKKQLFVYGASILAATLAGGAEQADERYVQVAEIEIDPVQLDAYRSAVQEQIDAAIRTEPGVLVLYAVSEKDNPAHVKVFEIYRDLRSSPRIRSFQEIQDDGGQDGEVAQADAGHPDHARCPIEVRRGNQS